MSRLQDRLDRIRESFEKQAPAEALAIMHRAVADIRASSLLEKTPKVGDSLPAFELPDTSGGAVRLGDALAKGPLVLAFYRGFW